MDARGSLWCWGSNNFHALGDDSFASRASSKAVRFAAFPGVSPVQWLAGEEQTCAIGGSASALFCTGGRRSAPRDDAASVSISWASGGTLTGVLRASVAGSYQCAIVRYPGAPTGAGQVACWGWRTGPVVGGACGIGSQADLCTIATPMTAPVP